MTETERILALARAASIATFYAVLLGLWIFAGWNSAGLIAVASVSTYGYVWRMRRNMALLAFVLVVAVAFAVNLNFSWIDWAVLAVLLFIEGAVVVGFSSASYRESRGIA